MTGQPRRRLVGLALHLVVGLGTLSLASLGAAALAAQGANTRVNTFRVTEVGVGRTQHVALQNFTQAPGALAGLYLCQGTRCFGLPKRTVKPGRTIRIAVGNGAGLKNVVARGATIGKLRPRDGEIALYASRRLSDPKAILTYLQWGSAKHPLTATAVKAGLWPKGAYAPTSANATLLYRTSGGLWVFK